MFDYSPRKAARAKQKRGEGGEEEAAKAAILISIRRAASLLAGGTPRGSLHSTFLEATCVECGWLYREGIHGLAFFFIPAATQPARSACYESVRPLLLRFQTNRVLLEYNKRLLAGWLVWAR